MRPLAHTPSASTSKQALLRATRPAHARAASTAVAAAAPATEAAAVSSTSYVHDPTPNAHLPRLARAEPELFAAVRPPPLSAFAALTARLGLLPSSLDAESRERRIRLVHQACTHPSFQALVDKINAAAHLQLEPSAAASGLAKKHGATALDAAQFLPSPRALWITTLRWPPSATRCSACLPPSTCICASPTCPTRVLKAAVSAYVGPITLADVAAELGLAGQGILRWNKEARIPPRPTSCTSATDAVAAPKRSASSDASSSSGPCARC